MVPVRTERPDAKEDYMPEVDDLEPVDETLVVIVAEDDGDLFCLVDDDGAPAVYKNGDPEVQERIREARDVYGAAARALSVEEFKALPDDAE
jgi:hypothetical protein